MPAPVVQELDAEYFDTAELALLAADIGLRRRRGGDDAGWHVKIARSKGERVEVHEPLDGGRRGRPPEALRDLVTARTRRAPLERVARLRTRRTLYRLLDDEGEPLAEVADDTVTADVTGQPPCTWREIEVELTGGDRKLMAAVEQRAAVDRGRSSRPPAPSWPACSATGSRRHRRTPMSTRHRRRATSFAATCESRSAALIDVDPAVRVDLEDAVHKMRVATRRLRSALATYRRLLDTDVTEPIRAELKWLGGVLGSVRDAEVIRDHLDRGRRRRAT